VEIWRMRGGTAMIGRARRLRRNTTEAERLLWDALRKDQLGWRFRRQHPIPPYVVDFAFVEALVWKHASSSRPMVDSMAALAIIMLGIKRCAEAVGVSFGSGITTSSRTAPVSWRQSPLRSVLT
jgi:hypothetical protein